MKISRRGKLARRGKHTKRAGKHLGYKSKSKKFRGSKRYHRGNKRTYKRGRRLHVGGFNCDSIVLRPLYKLRNGLMIPQSDDSEVRRRYFSIDTPEIFYTKTGSRFAMEDHSKFTMYVDFIITGDKVDLVIVFIRDVLDDKSPTFVFKKQGTTGEIKEFLKTMAIKLTSKDQPESDEKLRLTQDNNIFEPKIFTGSPIRVYSFKSPKNVDTFSKIADCIKSKIPGVVDAIIPPHLVDAATAPATAPAPATAIDDDYSTQG
jgi:hypothetical protein